MALAVAAGKSNRQVTTELYISVKTVGFHLGQILRRLELDSRPDSRRARGVRHTSGPKPAGHRPPSLGLQS
jgi:ATP/maltotriose-dependent transcriptional regulator MalT